MEINVEVEFDDFRSLKEYIGTLDRNIEEISMQVLEQVCQLIVGYAKILVPVDTGSLRDSIRMERGGIGMDWAEYRVRAGGYIINPKSGKLVNYAAAVEFWAHYMEGAIREAEPELQMLWESRLVEVSRQV